jgi:hypothetical protein
MRRLTYCILGVGLMASATACGGGDDNDGAGEVGADTVEVSEAAGEAPRDDLSGELLSVDDLDGASVASSRPCTPTRSGPRRSRG